MTTIEGTGIEAKSRENFSLFYKWVDYEGIKMGWEKTYDADVGDVALNPVLQGLFTAVSVVFDSNVATWHQIKF